jgi:hypothetical protein
MSRIIDAELAAIRACVARFPEGISLEQIEVNLPLKLPRRTLQRRIAGLVAEGQLRVEGKRRSTRYLPGNPTRAEVVVQQEGMRIHAQGEIQLPLSAEGREIEQHVLQPLPLRRPVGYQREFLDQYRPNVSFYLPPVVREELHACGHVASVDTPAGTYARQIFNRLLIDLSWNSSRLEGNTYSLLETERLLSAGEQAQGKDARETQMILNHKDAIEFLVEAADEIGFNRYTLLNLHALLSDNLLDDPLACGRLRSIAVGIGHTVFHPLEGPQRIAECFQQVLDTAAAIKDPFEQAFFVMVQLPYLQPFEDVNKRVSRLAANIPLIRHNLCPLAFADVPQKTYISAMLGIYELNRIELLRDVFVWAYKRSCARYSAVRQSLGEPDPFRMRYRQLIGETVAQVVRQRMGKSQAIAFIRQLAQSTVPPTEQPRFIEICETQTMSLHEGNIARYRLRPSEYQAWREVWQ